jgi:hypothetical protein
MSTGGMSQDFIIAGKVIVAVIMLLWTQPQHLQEKTLHPCNLAPMDHSPLRKNVQMRAALPGVGILQNKDLSLQLVQ